MKEIEVYKKMFIDKDKAVLFDYVSKPSFKKSIRHDEKFKKFDDSDHPCKTYDESYIDLFYNSYYKIKNKKVKTYETKTLLKLVDSEIMFFQ